MSELSKCLSLQIVFNPSIERPIDFKTFFSVNLIYELVCQHALESCNHCPLIRIMRLTAGHP